VKEREQREHIYSTRNDRFRRVSKDGDVAKWRGVSMGGEGGLMKREREGDEERERLRRENEQRIQEGMGRAALSWHRRWHHGKEATETQFRAGKWQRVADMGRLRAREVREWALFLIWAGW
jgi:chromosome segregation ATPase